MGRSGLQIVFFDAAFTVIEPWPGVGAVYAREARRFGVEADPAALDNGFIAAWKAARSGHSPLPYGRDAAEARVFWRRVVAGSFAGAGAEMPGGDYFDAVFDLFGTGACWRTYPDVAEAVGRVRAAGLRTGLLSNFDARLHGILDDLRLRPLFDCVVISCDALVEKPDPAIFHHAMERARVAVAHEAALIGDSPSEDIAGAAAAGWHSALVDRHGRHSDGHPGAARGLVAAVEGLLA